MIFYAHELMMNVLTANLIQNISRTEQFRVLNSFPDIVNLENSFKYISDLWQMFNTPIVRFVPILFNSSHCSPYS